LKPFDLVLPFIAFIAGAISSVTGFGIGTILTPTLGFAVGVKLAVAAVSVPHCIGNAVRFWTLRDRVDMHVLKTFGVMSAGGALVGSLLHVFATNPWLRSVLAIILILAGLLGVTGLSDRIRFGRTGAWIGGATSGLLGGLIGNQGGIRAAAMLAFDVPKESFVATTTAIALIVDAVRLPIYGISEGRAVLAIWPYILIASVAVLAGTWLGKSVLGKIPENHFRRIVALLLLILGLAMFTSR
jgi:uncharacterized membrane protein YfcA